MNLPDKAGIPYASVHLNICQSFALAKQSLPCNTDITMEEEDAGDTVPKKVKNKLSIFAAKRGITEYDIKIRTVTSPVDATVKVSLLTEPDFLRRMDRNAKVLGILRLLLSVYVNSLVHDEGVHAHAEYIVFDPAVLYHLLMYLTRSEMRRSNKKSPRKLDFENFALVKAHVLNYTQDNIEQIPLEQKNWLQNFREDPRRSSGARSSPV